MDQITAVQTRLEAYCQYITPGLSEEEESEEIISLYKKLFPKKYLFTIGQSHVHKLGGKTIDSNSVLVINSESMEEARSKAVDLLGLEFHQQIPYEEWDHSEYALYYPKTIDYVNSSKVVPVDPDVLRLKFFPSVEIVRSIKTIRKAFMLCKEVSHFQALGGHEAVKAVMGSPGYRSCVGELPAERLTPKYILNMLEYEV